jgi:hypothetical protein
LDASDPFEAFVSAIELSPAMFGALGVRNSSALPRFGPLVPPRIRATRERIRHWKLYNMSMHISIPTESFSFLFAVVRQYDSNSSGTLLPSIIC